MATCTEQHHLSGGLEGVENPKIESIHFVSTSRKKVSDSFYRPDYREGRKGDAELIEVKNPKIESIQFVSTTGKNVSDSFYRPDYHEGRKGDAELIAKARRESRKDEANDFRKEYYYGRCKDKKTCIWTGGGHDSWSNDPSSGITWVGVHGKDSICVVTKHGDLDVSRVHGFLIFSLQDEVFRNFRRAVISEIEDLADPSSELREKRDKRIKTPFGVVSVVPPSDKIHKASSYVYKEKKLKRLILKDIKREEEVGVSTTASSDDDNDFDVYNYNERLKYRVKLSRRRRRTAPKAKDVIPGYEETKTVKFLQDKMKKGEAIPINEIDQESGDKYYVKKATSFLKKKMTESAAEDFTLKETVKTAISAFQRLFNKNFKANEIEVSVMDPNYFVLAKGDRFKDIYVNHLETLEIEKYLDSLEIEK